MKMDKEYRKMLWRQYERRKLCIRVAEELHDKYGSRYNELLRLLYLGQAHLLKLLALDTER